MNVGHGDSIVLEYHGDNSLISYAVIDSNCKFDSSPPALELLQSLGAEELSFVAITHPHADHYMGMRKILEHFSNRIDTLYTFPIRRERKDIIKAINIYKSFAINTDSETSQKKLLEWAHILKLAANGVAKFWEDPNGTKNLIGPVGFPTVAISTILPPARVKGKFFQSILDGSNEPEKEPLNNLSMAFLIEYAGHQIVLAGDGTNDNWTYQSRSWDRIGVKLNPVAVKLPHHGSKHDCDALVQNVIFGRKENQHPNAVACISANGKSHPAYEVLDELVKRGIRPYCTNLATRCGNTREGILKSQDINPTLLRFITSAVIDCEDSVRPCQGNITLELLPGEPLQIKTQYKNLCGLRGDYDFLSQQTH